MGVEKNKLLYDSLLRFLVNSVSSPDSAVVVKYYDDNKNEKYLDPEKVVVRQIKVESQTLADSLFVVVSGNPSLFNSLASKFSVNRRDSGGLMAPFERGKYNFLGEAAFSLAVGGVAGPIENLDKTFSVIFLERRIKSKPVAVSRVYKRIESLLVKEYQEKIKKETFDGYLYNPSLVFGEKYEKFFN